MDNKERAELQSLVNLLKACDGNKTRVAQVTGTPRTTLREKLEAASKAKLRAQPTGVKDALVHLAETQASDIARLTEEVKDFRRELKKARKESVDASKLEEMLFGVASQPVKPPTWLVKPKKAKGKKDSPLVPITLWSDFHWGEVVDPAQINGVNEYNVKIARGRFKKLVELTTYLLTQHVTNPDYPGIVVPMMGDMVSGSIHEELSETNELSMPETVADLAEILIWGLRALADTFGTVYVPCVVGNHGRLAKKPRAKGAPTESWDWMVYKMVEMNLLDDDRIMIDISRSLDLQFRVYDSVYNVTHGDQFSGGGGIAGPYTPWMRGDLKKRRRQETVDQGYDVLLMGHWHTLQYLKSLICNGSVKGYDEYAFRNNFDFEPPKQALFLQHATHGIVDWRPLILADGPTRPELDSWCSIRK